MLCFIVMAQTAFTKDKTISTKKFSSIDIGSPHLVGKTVLTENSIAITAAGADIWGKRDEFRYVYIEKEGDFDIIARIESLDATHLYTKAGIMAREELTDNSRHVYFQIFPNNEKRNKNNGGYEFQFRNEKAGEMMAIYPASFEGTPKFPVNFPDTWIRLKRNSNVFTAYYSIDGTNWEVYCEYNIVLPSKLYWGFAVTSHDSNASTSSVFTNISEKQ